MNMKSTGLFTVLTLLVLIFGFTTFEFGKMYFKAVNDKNRIERSWNASKQEIVYYKAKNGDLVAKNDVLQLKYSELKDIYPEIISELKNLKINPRRVEHFSETIIQQQKDIITTLKDSLIYDTVLVRVFNYHDVFYTIKGIAIGDTQKVHIESRDSLIQVVFRGERYKPLWWIFSKRKLQQVVSCKNPNNKVEYSQIIEITK